ncbi:MAG: LysR substrate-binding domain-containing protein [Burkholderiaceae bacterium]
MDLRDLRYFETIAELQHMGRASAKLHRTQQALSSCVRRLEHDYGATLLEKSGRGIRLTEAGKVMQKWAQRFRYDAEDARQEIAAIGKGLTGHVRIGIVPTAAQFLLPAVAQQLLVEAPEVTFRTTVGLVDALRPLLRSGEIDLMVGTASAVDEGFASKVIAEDAIVVAASAKHELLRGSASLKDLVGYRWALQPPGAPTRDWLDHTFDRKRLPRPRVQVESTMLLMLPTLIERTGLLSFISRHHLQARGGRSMLKEVAIKEATMHRRLVVSHRAKAYLSPAASRVVELFSSAHPEH